jgi:hypothetical protein
MPAFVTQFARCKGRGRCGEFMAEGISAQKETGAREPHHRQWLEAGLRLVTSSAVRLHVFSVTTFVAAVLLTLTPVVVAQVLLPRFGGVPSVWSVTLAFSFVSIVVGGGYAYALTRYMPPLFGISLHACLSVLAASLSSSLAQSSVEPGAGAGYLWLFGTLIANAGLPLVLFTATIALLPTWLAGDGNTNFREVLHLRSVASSGVFFSLALYATVVDGHVGLSGQTTAFTVGVGLFALLVALAGRIAWLNRQSSDHIETADDIVPANDFNDAVSWSTRSLWILMAGMPAALLVAVTAWLSIDFVSAPIVWLSMLLIYCLSLHMGSRTASSRRTWLPAAMLVLVLLQLPASPFAGRMWLVVLSFFIASSSFHTYLYAFRPAARRRPEFARWITFGMAMGSSCAAFIAPHVFTGQFELIAFFIAALFCLPGLLIDSREPVNRQRIVGVACLLLALLMLETDAVHAWGKRGQQGIVLAVGGLATMALFLTREWVTQRVVLMLGLLAIGLAWPQGEPLLRADRSFFGTVQIPDNLKRASDVTAVMLGRAMETVRIGKGTQRIIAAESPDIAQLPVVPVPILVGVVGIGSGDIACTAGSGDAFRFFEINPRAINAARGAFPFLTRCTPQAPIVAGDMRQSLLREPDEAFDFLVVDLDTFEALPAHLLTVEAFRLYMSRVSDRGIFAVRLKNHSMDLVAPIASAINAIAGLQAAVIQSPVAQTAALDSTLIFVARHPQALDGVLTWPEAEGLPRSSTPPWTDDRLRLADWLRRNLLK